MRKPLITGRALLVIAVFLLSALVLPAQPAMAAVQRVKFTSGNNYLIVEFLDDDLVHFELSGLGPGPSTSSPIFTTPQIAKTNHSGPTSFTQTGNIVETADIRVVVDPTTLCVTTTDKTRSPALQLNQSCPLNLSQAWKGLTMTKDSTQNVYGLGEQFFMGGSADGDWDGHVRSPGGNYGNAMVYDTDNGPVGNAQIPVMFAVGANNANYGIFFDHIYKQQWSLNTTPYKVETWGDELRWYLMTGPNLPDLRMDYMELTGRPPVPPKKALGLWVSEYSYDNWTEIDNRLGTLRTNTFSVDGFVLDLRWFGGVAAGSDTTNMGKLSWDITNFPTRGLRSKRTKTLIHVFA